MQYYITRQDLKNQDTSKWPEWLKNATTIDPVVDISNNKITWENGVWLDGSWAGNEWLNGIWINGIWNTGTWINGIWNYGHMINALWLNGIWLNGYTENASFRKGLWKNGIASEKTRFESMQIENGTFEDKSISTDVYNRLKKIIKLPSIKDTPSWIRNSQLANALYQIENNKLIWYYGNWLSGTWKDGIWKNGVVSNINWKDGIWENGYWKYGIWNTGTWNGGYWKDGVWMDGEWKYGIFNLGARVKYTEPTPLVLWDNFTINIVNKLSASQIKQANTILSTAGGLLKI